MTVICLNQFGDFDMKYTDSIWLGEGSCPHIEKGTLKENVIKELKLWGFKSVKTIELTLTDDYYCSLEDKEKWEDRRLRLC